MGFKELIQLLKAKEYYKNLLVFLPLLFVREFFNFNSFVNVFFGFVSLCLVSSSYYIINDIIDIEKDKNHPEKKQRPLASSKISINLAFIFSIILFLTSFFMGIFLDYYFTLIIISLFTLTLFYSLHFKKIFLVDILFISTNFILRPLSGVFLVYTDSHVRISPWLILVSFFLAFYLSSAKKRSNYLFLGKTNYNDYNKNLIKYDKNTTSKLFMISTSILILVYSIFTFFSDHPKIFVTIPLVMYAILYHHQKIEEKSIIGRDLFYAFKDKILLFCFFSWTTTTFIIIYLL